MSKKVMLKEIKQNERLIQIYNADTQLRRFAFYLLNLLLIEAYI